MTTIEKVACSTLSVSPDGTEIWSKPEVSDLGFDDEDLFYGDTKIPFKNINHAVINKESFLFFPSHYTLLVETDSCSYLFNLSSLEKLENLPFPLQKTEGGLFDFWEIVKPSLTIGILIIIVLLITEIFI